MSMICTFRRLPNADLERLVAEPALVEEYLDPDAELEGFGPFADLDVDKAWHGIHFLLTGTAWEGESPLNFVAVGGTEVGDDLGYGPARVFTSAEVKRIAQALEGLTEEQLARRFDPKAMQAAEIYPDIWTRSSPSDDARGYLLGYCAELKDFVAGAAINDEALLVYLS